jgi:hypothetical protein
MFEIKNTLGGVPCDGCNQPSVKSITVACGLTHKRFDLCKVCLAQLKNLVSRATSTNTRRRKPVKSQRKRTGIRRA